MAKTGIPLEEQFFINESGCWIFTGSHTADGYGQKTINYRSVGAHVHMWEKKNGPVPEGFELDHICRQRDCMNPEHLELVTHQENCFRKSQLRVDMRSDYQNGLSIDEIAAKFGISKREDLIEQEEDSDASYMQRGLA